MKKFHVNTQREGYMPSLCSESPTHLAVIAAAISGTMYCRPPVNSNIITTNDTTTYTHKHNHTSASSPFSRITSLSAAVLFIHLCVKCQR